MQTGYLGMKINSISYRQPHFSGTPERLYQRPIFDYHDALAQWECLRHASYLDVHDDKFCPSNKQIREYNYSFLDKLTSPKDKLAFIQAFCEFTGFPNLEKMSKKIDEEYSSCLKEIEKEMQNGYSQGITLVRSGYDPNCSLGLRKSFTGSDIDKGYAIFDNTSAFLSDKDFADRVKGKLWSKLDQRIVSVNHPDTYPEIYTVRQINDTIDYLDKFSYKGSTPEESAKNFPINFLLTLSLKLPRFFNSSTLEKDCLDLKNSDITDPYTAAKFNRIVSMALPKNMREKVKNFAFFIETVDENLRENYPNTVLSKYYSTLYKKIMYSLFVRLSNVNQIRAWHKRIQNGYLKTKLRNREKLEQDFSSMSIDDKYALIKDIIKASSNDQSDRFSQYFKNDDDIKARYDRLLESLK